MHTLCLGETAGQTAGGELPKWGRRLKEEFSDVNRRAERQSSSEKKKSIPSIVYSAGDGCGEWHRTKLNGQAISRKLPTSYANTLPPPYCTICARSSDEYRRTAIRASRLAVCVLSAPIGQTTAVCAVIGVLMFSFNSCTSNWPARIVSIKLRIANAAGSSRMP